MTPSPIPGFLTKKEVAELYGRSHRSLTRDFSSAVRTGNLDVLTHLKIRTDDEKIREGTAVSLEQIQAWSNRGLSPTWYIEREWAERQFGVEKEAPVPSTSARSKTSPRPARDPTVFISDESVLIRRLEEQINDLKRDKDELRGELSIKNEQIQQANERTRESNVLMKELQTLLGEVQQRALLPLPMQSGRATSADSRSADAVIEPHPTAVQQVARAPAPKPRQRTRQDSKRKSKAQPTTPSTSSSETATASRPKHRWYELPTVKRIFGGRS